MNLKGLFGILVFIVIVNIVAVDTYLYYNHQKISGTISESVRPAPGTDNGENPFPKLNNSQRNEMRNILEEFKKSTGELNGKIRNHDNEIYRLMEADSINRDSIDMHLKEISSLRMEISKIAIARLIETKKILSRDQQEQLFAAILRSRPTMPQRLDSGEAVQDKTPRPMPPKAGMNPPPFENRLRRLSQKLNLTKAQIAQLESILKESQPQQEKLRAVAEKDPVKFREQMKSIMDAEDAKIENILTSEQKKIFIDLKNERREPEPRPE